MKSQQKKENFMYFGLEKKLLNAKLTNFLNTNGNEDLDYIPQTA